MSSYRPLTRLLLFCFLIATVIGSHGRAIAQGTTSFPQYTQAELAFSQFASANAQDPADAVCPRFSSGSTVSNPPQLVSQNGVLEVTFKFETTVDAKGLTRYCYITDTGLEAPTLRVSPGDKLIIHFQNDIPAAQTSSQQMPGMKMQLSDSTTDSACNAQTMDATSTNLHFHGVSAPPVCHQDEVIHTIIQPQQTFDYTVQIPSNEPLGLYWYHPHPHGFSEAQVLGGASGALIIQDANNPSYGLPEKILVVRDQAVSYSGTQSGVARPQTDLSLNYVPITYPTNTPAVIQTAPAEKELWRVLNASADTLLDLQVLINNVPQPLQIVAIDGVPIESTSADASPVTDYVLSSASRVEFTLTTPSAGQTATLITKTWNNGPDGDADPGRTIANIVPVGSSTAAAQTTTTAKPARLTRPPKESRFAALDSVTPTTSRTLYFSETSDFSQFYITVDGQTPKVFDMNAAPNIVVQDGTVEEWTIENRSKMDHNFHIHQIHFQVLAVNGKPVTDTTLRDTIDVPHWSGNTSDAYPSVSLLMDFRDPGIVGTFPYHCHILSHEDRGMMGAIQVQPASTTTTLTASATQAAFGTAVTFTATVAGTGTTGNPSGTVTFYNGTTTLGTATLDASGAATYSTSSLPIGSNSITAVYAGNTSFTTSTSNAVVVNITQASSTSSLTASATTITSGASVTFTATVTGVGTTVPTGSVTFLNGTTALGTATLNSSGVATFATSALPVGTDSITAQYGGDATFTGSTSAALVITVNPPPPADFSLSITPNTLSLDKGQSGTATLTITPVNGFAAPVALSCSGLPAGTQCTFNPQSVTSDGTHPAATTITITTSAQTALLHRPLPLRGHPYYAFLLPGVGALLGLVIPGRRRLPRNLRIFGLTFVLFCFAALLTACGSSTKAGGGGTPTGGGTPAGTSTVTVTASSSGNTTISHTGTLTLTVTQ